MVPPPRKERWAYTWDTSDVENGPHSIHVRSHDGEDYSEVTSISVVVNNKDDSDNDDECYEEPLYLGGLTAAIIVVVVVVVLFIRKRNEDYYDDWGENEDSDEEW